MTKPMKIAVLFLTIISLNTHCLVSPIGFSFTSEGEYGNFPPKDWSVYGIRFNVFGAENKQVVGLDFGGYNVTTDLIAGMQMGLFNHSKKDAYFILGQFGLMNSNKGKTYALGTQFAVFSNYNKGATEIVGIQFALANVGNETSVYGWQMGVYNKAKKIVGFQMGLINYVDSLYGIQLGLLNFCNSCFIPVSPGINIGF